MRIALGLTALLVAAPSFASTPTAWAQEAAAAARACRIESGLLKADMSAPIVFPDDAGLDAMLVTGVWPQPHRKRARGTVLCLYDRHTRSAKVTEAPGWSAGAR